MKHKNPVGVITIISSKGNEYIEIERRSNCGDAPVYEYTKKREEKIDKLLDGKCYCSRIGFFYTQYLLHFSPGFTHQIGYYDRR
jgi:hypothetical protein